ncbi:MAG: enoyl-CoA hydratase/isomerase family protein [Polyangiaceae bacterium]|nr:enoyl-CoA hydratase/isomerase family protein [Polyangiaceae bacterium]
MRTYRTILYAVQDGVATLTLNRPERRNAIGSEMANELLWALEDAFADPLARSVVLTGAGKAFCAGGDFLQMSGGDAGAEPLPPKGGYDDLLRVLWRAPKPVVAKVNGHALGGGLGIAAACTFAVASTEAKLGTPEIEVGLFPFMILAILGRHVPRRRLLELMLGGEKLSAEEAARIGLVNRAVAPAELDDEVKRWTDRIASKSASTIRLGLRALADAEELALDEQLPMLAGRLAECLGTDDAREGLMAFLEKRPARWTGS